MIVTVGLDDLEKPQSQRSRPFGRDVILEDVHGGVLAPLLSLWESSHGPSIHGSSPITNPISQVFHRVEFWLF